MSKDVKFKDFRTPEACCDISQILARRTRRAVLVQVSHTRRRRVGTLAGGTRVFQRVPPE
jgi:hypothetical protein